MQRDNSLGEHMCAYDELGVDTDGTSRKRGLGVAVKVKKGDKKPKKFGQPCELVNKEGKTKAIRVTVGLIVWRKSGLYTKPWIQHSGNKMTWSHVWGLQGFAIGISKNGRVTTPHPPTHMHTLTHAHMHTHRKHGLGQLCKVCLLLCT